MMEYNKMLSEMLRNTEVEGFYILKNCQSKVTSQGKPFMNMMLSDRSGEMKAVVWDYSGPVNEVCEGKIIKIRGQVTEYNGTLQITVEKLREAVQSDVFDLTKLIPTAPIDIEAEYEGILKTVQSLNDYDYRRICEVMLSRHGEAFKKVPAAKSVHHAFLGGLLMHTSTMLKAAEFYASLYPDIIDRSLLIAGTLLHDLEKVNEFTFSEYGLATEYSTEGQLLGHLVMGAREINEIAIKENISPDKSVLLQHLIISHHGKPEFGAAVVPMCAEAEVLAHIDDTDAKMEIYRETYEKLNGGEFSQRIYALEKRIFRH